MVRALRDRDDLLGALALDVRSGWARSPTLLPALFIGIATAVAPLLILQPGMGAGIASRKTARPVFNCIKSLVTHAVFGLGMYLAALATASLPLGK